MPFQKGNKLTLRRKKKPTGRKSAYAEHSAAEIIKSIYNEDQDTEALRNKIKTGKYSGFDIVKTKILQGNDRIMVQTLENLLPKKVDIEATGEVTLNLITYGANDPLSVVPRATPSPHHPKQGKV